MKKIGISILSIIGFLLIIFMIFLTLLKFGLLFEAPIPFIKRISVDKEKYVNIYFEYDENGVNDKLFYLVQKNPNYPDVNSNDWKMINGNTIKYLLDDVYYVFLKNEDNVMIKVDNTEKIGMISNFEIDKYNIYLPIKGTYLPTISYDVVGSLDEKPFWYSEDNSIASVQQSGLIIGNKKGKTKIHVKLSGNDISTDVVVTDLITKRPKKYNKYKKFLPCGIYSEEDNDLIDRIFKSRIKDAGYKTRAGVVEAGRFYTLEFPYQLEYFNENGRLSGNGIDGEGRYYHKGFYLHKSRYENIKKSGTGPQIWGCNLYSWPVHRSIKNGLDCSGFISWILYNGGFDVKDVGAGVTSNKLDLTDYGEKKVLTSELEKSGKIRVGDLLSSGGPSGGHIALIIGKDKKNYYVIESLWTTPNVGIRVYSRKNFVKRFYWVMLMDSYYKEDGNLTDMWY